MAARDHHGTTSQTAIHERLRRLILSGALGPGTRLVERDLAQTLGVSRTPIREALRQLAQEGLVQGEPYRGAVVTRLTPEYLADMVPVRANLEAMAARLAAPRLTAADLEGLAQLVDGSEAAFARGDLGEVQAMNHEFHARIHGACGNRVVQEMLSGLHAKIALAQTLSLGMGMRPAHTAREHRAIIAALATGEGEAAARTMFEHVQRAGETALRALALRLLPAQGHSAAAGQI